VAWAAGAIGTHLLKQRWQASAEVLENLRRSPCAISSITRLALVGRRTAHRTGPFAVVRRGPAWLHLAGIVLFLRRHLTAGLGHRPSSL